MHRLLVRVALMATLGVSLSPGSAFAQSQAYTTAPVNVRGGPAPDYPVVAQLPGGASVSVMGCVSGYTWCDVTVPGVRGWVYGGNLSYPYQGNTVPLMSYGPTIGLPIVVFSLNTYWGNYYRNRPWYRDRSRWMNRPPPRPPIHGGRPPGNGNGYRPGPGQRPGQGNVRPPGPRPQPGQGAGRPGRPGGSSGDGVRPGRPGPGAQPGGGRPGGGQGRPGQGRPGQGGNARPPGGRQ